MTSETLGKAIYDALPKDLQNALYLIVATFAAENERKRKEKGKDK